MEDPERSEGLRAPRARRRGVAAPDAARAGGLLIAAAKSATTDAQPGVAGNGLRTVPPGINRDRPKGSNDIPEQVPRRRDKH